MRTPAVLLPLLTLLTACTPDAPVQYRVPDLRIIAINATVDGTVDTADADPGDGTSPGETSTLTALVANPLDRPAPTVSWFACAPPIEGSPCDPTQLRDLDAFETAPGVFFLGSGGSFSLVLSSAALPVPLWLRIDAAMQYVASPEFPLSCDRYAELPVVAIVRGGGVAEAALKRLRLRPTVRLAAASVPDYYDLNHNPAIPEIRANPTAADCGGGVPLTTPCLGPADCGGGICAANGFCALPVEEDPTCVGDLCAPPTRKVTLCAPPMPASSEGYRQCTGGQLTDPQPDPPPAEELQRQWYVTAGEIAGTDFNGNAVSEELELTPAAGGFTLWLIVRDGRGGTSWVERAFVP